MTEEEKFELQVLIGSRVWLEAARLAWPRLFPEKNCPIGDFDEINDKGRRFMHAVMTRVFAICNDEKRLAEVKNRFDEDGLIL